MVMKNWYIILILFCIFNADSFAKNCESFSSASDVDAYVKTHDINTVCNDAGDTVLNYNVMGCTYLQSGKCVTPEVVQELLKMGANPNKVNNLGETPLVTVLFAGCSNLGTEEILIEAGTDPNKADNKGYTPLMWSLEKKNAITLVNLLLDKKADINAQDKRGRTALMQASDTSIINLLISRGAQINIKDKEGKTAVVIAAQNDKSSLVEELYKHGASLTVTDKKKNSIIINSIKERGSSYIVSWLVEHGAPIDKQNNSGMTPLMVAAYKGNLEIVKTLLIHGANIALKANNGATVESFAKASGNMLIANYIKNYAIKAVNDKTFSNMI